MSLSSEWSTIKQRLIAQIQQRGVRASNEICDTARQICSGHSPSSPGSPPGMKSGSYAAGFIPRVQYTANGVIAGCDNSVSYGPSLENGHGQQPGRFVPALGKKLVAGHVAARPHFDMIEQQSAAKVQSIFSEPYE